MNTQGQQFFDSRILQIALLAALSVALMIGAAYFFGTGLYADTQQSVAASPIGSSLTAVRGANPSADSLKVLEERWAPFYAGLDKALKDAGARP
jgi:hypothetical protein